MITIDLDDFMFELKDGALKHVGASNRSATAKLYDVEEAAVTEFGDERVKLSCEDDDGNEVQIALSPAIATQVADRIDTLEDESEIFE